MSAPCIILAGGLGTRLQCILPNIPKCLAEVAGRPFLYWQMDLLKKQGVKNFILSLGYGSDQVLRAINEWGSEFNIDYVIESKALGTGGAILYAMKSKVLQEALVINGDTYVLGDLSALVTNSLDSFKNERIRLASVYVNDRTRFGGLDVSDDGLVLSFIEKGQATPGKINAGLYRIDISAFDDNFGETFSFEERTLKGICHKQGLYATHLDASFIDIGVPEDYKIFCERQI